MKKTLEKPKYYHRTKSLEKTRNKFELWNIHSKQQNQKDFLKYQKKRDVYK